MEKLADDLLLRSQFIKLLILISKEGYMYVKSIINIALAQLTCMSITIISSINFPSVQSTYIHMYTTGTVVFHLQYTRVR